MRCDACGGAAAFECGFTGVRTCAGPGCVSLTTRAREILAAQVSLRARHALWTAQHHDDRGKKRKRDGGKAGEPAAKRSRTSADRRAIEYALEVAKGEQAKYLERNTRPAGLGAWAVAPTVTVPEWATKYELAEGEFDDLRRFWEIDYKEDILDRCYRAGYMAQWLNFVTRTLREPDAVCVVGAEDGSVAITYDTETRKVVEEGDPLAIVQACMAKEPRVQTALLPIVVSFGNAADDDHSNVLVFRRGADGATLRVENLEPYGYETHWAGAVDGALGDFFKAALERLPKPELRWEYVLGDEVVPAEGPQTREASVTDGSWDTEVEGDDGYCIPWSVMMAHLVVANPELSSAEVMEAAFGSADAVQLGKMVRGYAQRMHDVLGSGKQHLDVGDFVYYKVKGPDAPRHGPVEYARVVDASAAEVAVQRVADGKAVDWRVSVAKAREPELWEKVQNPERKKEAEAAFSKVAWPSVTAESLQATSIRDEALGELDIVYAPRTGIPNQNWRELYGRIVGIDEGTVSVAHAGGRVGEYAASDVQRVLGPARLAEAQRLLGPPPHP